MPGEMIQVGALVMCVHGGAAQPTAPNPRVKAMGLPTNGQIAPYAVAGCTFVPPIGIGPCVTAMWPLASLRVRSMGVIGFVIQGGTAVCVPTATGLMPAVFELRVRAR